MADLRMHSPRYAYASRGKNRNGLLKLKEVCLRQMFYNMARVCRSMNRNFVEFMTIGNIATVQLQPTHKSRTRRSECKLAHNYCRTTVV